MTEKALDQFNPLKKEIAKLVQPVFTLTVKSFETSEQAVGAAKDIKALLKKLDTKRRELVDPLKAEVKRIDDYVKEIKDPLDRAEFYIRGEINKFALEQEKIRQAEMRRAEEERRRKEEELRAKQEAEREALEKGMQLFGSDDDEPETATQEIEEQQAVETALFQAEMKQKEWDIKQQQIKGTRRIAKLKVLDITQVPKEFLIIEVNEKAALAAMKAGVKIPGLEIYHEISVPIGHKTRVTKESLEAERV